MGGTFQALRVGLSAKSLLFPTGAWLPARKAPFPSLSGDNKGLTKNRGKASEKRTSGGQKPSAAIPKQPPDTALWVGDLGKMGLEVTDESEPPDGLSR